MPKWVVFIGGAFAMLGALVVGVFIFTYFSSTRASCNAHSVMTLDSKEKTYRANLQTLMARSNSPTLGHPKFPQAGPPDYDDSGATAMRAAASLRR